MSEVYKEAKASKRYSTNCRC